jgi:urease accessory protein
MAIGEEWCFTRYRSINEVHIGTERVARDVLLLSQVQVDSSEDPATTTTTSSSPPRPRPRPRTLRPRTLAEKLAPYACYATLLLFGPATTALAAHLARVYDGIRQMQVRSSNRESSSSSPEALLWSFSPLANGRGCIVRVAGTETDRVKTWLKEQLRGLEEVVGKDAYTRAFV